MDHLKSQESLGQLGLQEIDKEQSGCQGAENGDDQGAGPGLGKDETDQKAYKKECRDCESEGGEEKVVGD
jgi:hypothetical protein